MSDSPAPRPWSDDPDDLPGPTRTTLPPLAAPLDTNVIRLALGSGFVGAVLGWIVVRRVSRYLEGRAG